MWQVVSSDEEAENGGKPPGVRHGAIAIQGGRGAVSKGCI
jgi:hypothetical protein